MIKAILPYTAGKLGQFRLTQLPQQPAIKPGLLKRVLPEVVTGVTTGYHGTTTKALGDQLKKGKFEDRGKKIYFAELETAVRYAAQKSSLDKSDAIVVKVYSEQRSKINKLLPSEMEGHGVSIGLGAYSYLVPEENPVYIQEVYQQETVSE
ncbi:MAG TPA: hypothetical protein VLF61_00240 [Rhabdochlamydiaceae bacterium]|nr:hypothetical protein [Rhabdochlamydiaceae bacterium]